MSMKLKDIDKIIDEVCIKYGVLNKASLTDSRTTLQQALSDVLELEIDVERVDELAWDAIQCGLDKGNYRAGAREELEQIFLEVKIPQLIAQAIAKECPIKVKEKSNG